MLNQKIKCCAGIFFSLISFYASAVDINVTVNTDAATAVAIGFDVGGIRSGGLGKSFSGKGPINQLYSFGFRKDTVFGDNVFCGTLVLNQDSIVNLIYKDNICIATLG